MLALCARLHPCVCVCVYVNPCERVRLCVSPCVCVQVSHLRETEVQHVGVQFVQRSGETVPAQVLSTELTVEQTGWSDRWGRGAEFSFLGLLHAVKVSPVAKPLG